MALTADDSTAYIIDAGSKAVYQVDIATGDRTIISNISTGTGDAFSGCYGIILNSAETLAYVVNAFSGNLMSVDLSNGNRVIVSSNSSVGSGQPLGFSKSITFNSDQTKIYAFSQGTIDNILEVVLANGNRTIISDNSTGIGHYFNNPGTISLHPDGNHIYTFDSTERALVKVNLSTGNRELVSK